MTTKDSASPITHDMPYAVTGGSAAGDAPAGDAAFVARLRGGDKEAVQRFIRDNYPEIYRYFLFLTGRRDVAEDLTQETFVRAWRGLETYEGRAPLRFWLHRIAQREFLRTLRGRQAESPEVRVNPSRRR
jgi:RNA polymerase sigma-70 factor (ECF subfamily)